MLIAKIWTDKRLLFKIYCKMNMNVQTTSAQCWLQNEYEFTNGLYCLLIAKWLWTTSAQCWCTGHHCRWTLPQRKLSALSVLPLRRSLMILITWLKFFLFYINMNLKNWKNLNSDFFYVKCGKSKVWFDSLKYLVWNSLLTDPLQYDICRLAHQRSQRCGPLQTNIIPCRQI